MNPFTLPLVFLALLSVLYSPVYAAKGDALREEATSPSNSTRISWIFPSSSSTAAFDSVDTVNVQWQSTYANPNLRLWCKNQSAGRFASRSNVNVASTGSRAVLLDITQNVDILICHFMLQDLENTALSSNSPPFTIQKAPNAQPQTWSANSPKAPTTSIAPSDMAAPTSTSTTDPAAPNGSSSTSSATASSSSSPSDGSGLSIGVGVGIGIGVAVLVVTLAVGGLLLFLRARQQKAQQSKDMPEDGSRGMVSKPMIVIPGIHETIGNRPAPQELDASQPSSPSDVMLARSEFERNEVAGCSPVHLGTASSRRGSDRSVGSSVPGSIRREPMEEFTGSPI